MRHFYLFNLPIHYIHCGRNVHTSPISTTFSLASCLKYTTSVCTSTLKNKPEIVVLKRIQQKLTRYEHHLENYSFLIRRKLVPHGLLSKTRPAFDSHNPYFFRSWKQNQQHFALQQLKLLIQECKIKIKDLRRYEIK